ncbi:MAG: hypothetical protein LBQ14_03590 [Treponema sp.]|jgi:hypothetical protein|nr:hypothetical protein [Treponema sp.]
MKEKQAVTREYKPRYQKAAKKAKSALLDEFTRLTGYHRKSAVRILNAKPVKPVMVYAGGKAVQLKPEIKRPPTGKASGSIPVRSSPLSAWSGPSSGSNAVGNEVSANPGPPHTAADALHRRLAGLHHYPRHR